MSDDRVEEMEDVLSRLLDSADGYENAVEQAENTRFHAMFREKAQQRRQFAAEIRSEVAAAGGDIDDDGTLLGKAHRLFTNLKASMSSGDEAVLEEIVRGEKKLVEEYREALDELTPGSPAAVKLREQLDVIERDLNQMRIEENIADAADD